MQGWARTNVENDPPATQARVGGGDPGLALTVRKTKAVLLLVGTTVDPTHKLRRGIVTGAGILRLVADQVGCNCCTG